MPATTLYTGGGQGPPEVLVHSKGRGRLSDRAPGEGGEERLHQHIVQHVEGRLPAVDGEQPLPQREHALDAHLCGSARARGSGRGAAASAVAGGRRRRAGGARTVAIAQCAVDA